jgi:hypothetical protein
VHPKDNHGVLIELCQEIKWILKILPSALPK